MRHEYHEVLFSKLSELNTLERKYLALSYAEHIRWIGGTETDKNAPIQLLIDAANQFMEGLISLSEVNKARNLYYYKTVIAS